MFGLLQAQYALVGVNDAVHVIGEVRDPHIDSPKVMVLSCILGSLHAFAMLVAVAASSTDPTVIIDAGPSAMLVAFTQSAGKVAGGIALTLLAVATILFKTPALLTSSCVIQSITEDLHFPLHVYLGQSGRRFEMPVGSGAFWTVCLTFHGAIRFGSENALTAVLNSSVILLRSLARTPDRSKP
ncbi:hypothetical protein ACQY0O_003660 [Thecaphora frezii]